MEPIHDTTARTSMTSKNEGRMIVMRKAVKKNKKQDGQGGPGVINNPLSESTTSKLMKMGIKPINAASASSGPGGIAPFVSKSSKTTKSAFTGAKTSIKALKRTVLKNAIKGAAKNPKSSVPKAPKIPKVK